jgi:LysM repeat protein
MTTPENGPTPDSKFRIPTWAAIAGGVLLLLALCLVAYQAGCRRQPAATPAVAPLVTAPPVALAPASATPSQSTGPGLTPTLPAPQAAPVSPSALATAECAYPPDWVVYTVQPLDTLFSLARRSGATVEQVQTANCLENDLIVIGQKLRLPAFPLPPTAAPDLPPAAQPQPAPQEPSAPTPAASPQAATQIPPGQTRLPVNIGMIEGLPYESFSLPGGSPNQPIDPCSNEQSPEPWIDIPPIATAAYSIGTHAYFYACNFPGPSDLKAEISGPSPISTVYLVKDVPYPGWKKIKDDERLVVLDLIPCNIEQGAYTLRVFDDQGHEDEVTIQIAPDPRNKLLVTPNYGDASQSYSVYLCGLPGEQVQEVELGIFYLSDEKDQHGDPLYKPFSTLKGIKVAEDGSIPYSIQFPAQPLYNYAIRQITGSLRDPKDYVWLKKP